MATYPTTALQPGSTNTAAVKQLQDYLVSTGYMTQAQVNTGYGTYGPQTTAAVLKLQNALGVDNSTGPGYWGPRTITAVQTKAAPAPKPATPAPAAPSPAAAPTNTGSGKTVAEINAAREANIAAGLDPYSGAGAKGQLSSNYVPPSTPAAQQPASQPQQGTTQIQTGSSKVPTVPIPDALANDAYFKQLDPENQAMVAYFYSTLNSQNTDKAKAFTDALSQAGQQADPYWREKINITKDELGRTLGTIDADLASHERDLMARKARIEEDLKNGKSDLSIDEQADLASLSEDLTKQIGDTRNTMAQRGLSSSSIRNQAEERVNTSNADAVESTTRKYARATREADLTAGRNVTDILNQISDLRRSAGEQKTDTARKAETYLGSGNMGDLGLGGLLSGNVTGTLYEQKNADILTRAQGLMAQKGLV